MHDRAASVSVEWAVVSLPFLGLVLCIFELTYDLYAQEALDMALQTAARQVAVGNLQTTVNSIATFQAQAFCPALSSFIPCTNVAINIHTVTDFTSASLTAIPITNGSLNPAGFTYCPGSPGQLVLAQAIYPAPSLLAQFIPAGTSSYNGTLVRLIVSNAGFVNENYPVTASAPAGC